MSVVLLCTTLGAAPGTTIAPPPPSESLNQTLVVVLIVLGALLFVLLVALVVYVCKLRRDFVKEREANDTLKKEKLVPLQEAKDEKEKQMLEDVSRRMEILKRKYEDSQIMHAKFVKDHDPEIFEEMKDNGTIKIAGDEIAEQVVQRDIRDELRKTENPLLMPEEFTDSQRQRILETTDRTDKVRDLKKQMKELRKKQEARRKERVLEDEKISLQQKLNDLELEEKLDSLRRLEKKQKEREAIDNIKTSKRLAITSNGEYIISRMGGNSLDGDNIEPYDSDYDFDDQVPELPEHLDNMNPRGKVLKAKLDEQRSKLYKDKGNNKQREAEMERDMSLTRLRINQQKRKNEKIERRAREAEEQQKRQQQEEDSEAEQIQSQQAIQQVQVPRAAHKPVPHFITSPWNVDHLDRHKPSKDRSGPRRLSSGKHAEKQLLNYVAEAMQNPDAQASALESRNYLLAEDPDEETIPEHVLKKGSAL